MPTPSGAIVVNSDDEDASPVDETSPEYTAATKAFKKEPRGTVDVVSRRLRLRHRSGSAKKRDALRYLKDIESHALCDFTSFPIVQVAADPCGEFVDLEFVESLGRLGWLSNIKIKAGSAHLRKLPQKKT